MLLCSLKTLFEFVHASAAVNKFLLAREEGVAFGADVDVDICSKCHPFFTGKQKFVDSGGRVDKFKKRLEAAKQH